MTDLAPILQQSAAHAWLFVPSAILLGALHGLEPGHSKTMMAAFIIAIRGTVLQATLLGLSATMEWRAERSLFSGRLGRAHHRHRGLDGMANLARAECRA
jgi:High-affinity nickel-transport protein